MGEKEEIVAQDYTKQIMKISSQPNMLEVAANMDGRIDAHERKAMDKVRHHLSDLEHDLKSSRKILGKFHHEVFNFNKLEEVCLASGIIVTLTGVMFTSPYLLAEENVDFKRGITYT